MSWPKEGPRSAWDEELVRGRQPGGCSLAAVWSWSTIQVRGRVVDAKVALTFLQFLPPIGGAYSPTLRLWPGLVTRFDPQTVAGVMSSTTRTHLLEVLQLPL